MQKREEKFKRNIRSLKEIKNAWNRPYRNETSIEKEKKFKRGKKGLKEIKEVKISLKEIKEA